MSSKRPSLRDASVKAKAEKSVPKSNPNDEGRKTMSLRLPKSLWRDLNLARIDEERSANEIIVDAIGQYLRK